MNQQAVRINAMAAIMVDARKAQEDVGEIIASSLYAASLRLKGANDLVSGRPGSWEADIVLKMAAAGDIGIALTQIYEKYITRLVPLFVEMGQACEDGGDVLSQAMGKAVDELGSLQAFVGQSKWYWDLGNIGCQYSEHWEEFSQL